MRKSANLKRRLKKPLYVYQGIAGLILLVLIGIAVVRMITNPYCANSISCIENLSGKKEAENKGVFLGKAVYAPQISDIQSDKYKNTQVLGDQTGEYKRIYVDLTNQKLYAFEGNNIVMNVPVSTGKWFPTPTGEFRVWIWLKYTRMSGGSGVGYYNLANVPYTMYYFNKSVAKSNGFSLHGAYWHNNFGHPMSHGCVNMRIPDAEKLFYWTNPSAGNVSYPASDTSGTLVTVYGRTPRE